MSNDVEVRINLRGLNQFMRSAPIQRRINSEAARISARAGDRFRMRPSPHKWVARAYVEPVPDMQVTHQDRIDLMRAL